MEPFTLEEKARLLQYGTQEELNEYVGLIAGRFDKDPSKERSPEESAGMR